jgi:hypothetical protein
LLGPNRQIERAELGDTDGIDSPGAEPAGRQGSAEKDCDTQGRRICAESFVLRHLREGEPEVAIDLLSYLNIRSNELRDGDPAGRSAMTEALAARIQWLLETERDDPPDPSARAAKLRARKAT